MKTIFVWALIAVMHQPEPMHQQQQPLDPEQLIILGVEFYPTDKECSWMMEQMEATFKKSTKLREVVLHKCYEVQVPTSFERQAYVPSDNRRSGI